MEIWLLISIVHYNSDSTSTDVSQGLSILESTSVCKVFSLIMLGKASKSAATAFAFTGLSHYPCPYPVLDFDSYSPHIAALLSPCFKLKGALLPYGGSELWLRRTGLQLTLLPLPRGIAECHCQEDCSCSCSDFFAWSSFTGLQSLRGGVRLQMQAYDITSPLDMLNSKM